MMKYAYIKYGNVVEELKQIGPKPKCVPRNGPLTFLSNFLKIIGGAPAIILSWDKAGGSNQKSRNGAIKAFSYKKPRGFNKFIGGLRIFLELIGFKPDVILCVHDGPGLWMAFLVSKILRIPIIHSRQRAIKAVGDRLHRRIIAAIDAKVIKNADGVICHGPFTRQQLLDVGVNKDKVIEFDVKFDIHHEGEAKETINHTKKEIVFLGRIEASKGVFELLEAMLPLLNIYDDICLTFIGHGTAVQKLRERAEKAEKSSKINFTGAIPHEQVIKRLRQGYILVTPTRRGLEGWPMAALEGIAAGVPVVGPNTGPFLFMIEDGVNGFLFKHDSIIDLRAKIQNIIESEALRKKLSEGCAIMFRKRNIDGVKDFGEALDLAFRRWTKLSSQG